MMHCSSISHHPKKYMNWGVMRVETRAEHIAGKVLPKQADRAKLAARLTQCDQVPQVIEFPSLKLKLGC